MNILRAVNNYQCEKQAKEAAVFSERNYFLLWKISPEEMDRIVQDNKNKSQFLARPQYFTQHSGKIYFYPIPDANYELILYET
jgi:hypothetical protein